jgi:hypothetical protein
MTIADWLASIGILIFAAVSALFFHKHPIEEPLEAAPPAEPPPVAVVEPAPEPETNAAKLYDVAKASLGKTMKLDPSVANLYGCASSLCGVLKAAGVEGLPSIGIASTRALCNWLQASTDQFEEVDAPQPGDIVMSASPVSPVAGQLDHGHVGVCAAVDQGIMSNDSDTGKWMEKWNLPDWLAYYTAYGGLPTRYFRRRG